MKVVKHLSTLKMLAMNSLGLIFIYPPFDKNIKIYTNFLNQPEFILGFQECCIKYLEFKNGI